MLKVIGGEQEGEFKAVASGTLPNGKPVVVNADGTVSVAAETSTSFGSAAVFESASTSNISSAYDTTNNKIVIAYQDGGNSSYGTAVVATISGTSVTYGTPVVFNSGNSRYTSCTFDPSNEKIVISYIDWGNNERPTSVVGTVSGTSISFGSEVVISNTIAGFMSTVFHSGDNKIIATFRDDSNSGRGIGYVGTVSGTSISYAAGGEYNSDTTNEPHLVYDSNRDRIIVSFIDAGTGYDTLTARVGTLSGNSISWGQNVQIADGCNGLATAFDSNVNKLFLLYKQTSTNNYPEARLGTISAGGTDISFTSATSMSSAADTMDEIAFDSSTNSVLIPYKAASTNLGSFRSATTDGTSITFSSVTVFENAQVDSNFAPIYDPDTEQFLISYRDADNSNYGTSIVGSVGSTNLTAENYIGMSRGVTDVQATSAGTPVVYEAATVFTYTQGIVYDSNANKTVISYVDGGNGNYGTAIVGTVSGTSISFGSPTVFETGVTGKPASVFDSTNNKIIVCYDDGGNGDYITAVVGTVSGTSISFGTPVVAHAAAVDFNAITYDTNSQRVVIAYKNRSGSDYGTAVVGTVSGTSISFGTPVVFSSANTSHISATFDSTNNKVVLSFRNAGNGYGQSIVGTVSGTSISFGSVVNITTSSSQSFASTFDTNSGKVVIAYDDAGAGEGAIVVGTVSGTSISFGTSGTFSSSQPSTVSIAYDSVNQKIAVPYIDGTSLTGIVATASVSGTDIIVDSETATFESGTSSGVGSTYDSSAGKVVTSYKDTGNSNYGTSAVITVGYENRYPVADGDNASMDLIGSVSTNQSGLTAGEKYYVQTDGTLSTTAGDPSVLAGTAISATKLVVKT